MSTLVALLLRLILLAALTFGFVVLFEHGVEGYKAGVPVEWAALKSFVNTRLLSGTADAPAPTPPPAPAATPTPEPVSEPVATPPPATPVPTPDPGAAVTSWQKLQSAPIGNAANLPIQAQEKPSK